jgi:hypothetical protein
MAARGEVMLEVGPAVDLGAGGLMQYTVSAFGTESEFINVFGTFNLTGSVHQVGSLGSPWSPTPTVDDHTGMGFDPSWSRFDTHWLFPRVDLVGFVGTPLAEQNDLATTGTLGLAQVMGFDAPSGFGDFATPNGAVGLLPSVGGSRVSFLQVVTGSAASLDIQVSFMDRTRSIASTVRFAEIPIGPSDEATAFSGVLKSLPPPPPTVEPPSPTVEPPCDEPPVGSDPIHTADGWTAVYLRELEDGRFVIVDASVLEQIETGLNGGDRPIGDIPSDAIANYVTFDGAVDMATLVAASGAGWLEFTTVSTDGGLLLGGTPLQGSRLDGALANAARGSGYHSAPEPGGIALCAMASIGLVGFGRRRRKGGS